MNESENLARLFAELKRDKNISRAEFARRYKKPDGTKLDATMINQHIKGDRPISLEYAQAYSVGFGVPLKEISPSNYEKVNFIKNEDSGIDDMPMFSRSTISKFSVTDFAKDLLNPDSINVPVLAAVASMGKGNENHEGDLVVDVLRISKDWANKTLNVTSLSNLSFIHAVGDSMSPTFNDGDILLVDSGAIDVKSDSVYVLEAHERLFIKRVRQKLDGDFEISSDNPAIKTVDVLNGGNEVTIKGRVVWVWNGKKI